MNTQFHLAQAVETAARSAGCPVGVFYLCGRDSFEPVAAYGCALSSAAAHSGLKLLDAARRQPDGLFVWRDAPAEPDLRPGAAWLFAPEAGGARFAAAIHVAYQQVPACGLLVVADRVPHPGLSMVERYALRANSAQITAMLELQARVQAASESGTQEAETDPVRERVLGSIARQVTDAILVTKAEAPGALAQHIAWCNAAFTDLTGYPEAEIAGRCPSLLSAGQDDDTDAKLVAALRERRTAAVSCMVRRKDGSEFLADIRVIPAADREGDFMRWFIVPRTGSDGGLIGEYRARIRRAELENTMLENEKAALEAEIEERKRIEARLHYAAFHDTLTSLYNRQYFIDRLAAAFERLADDGEFRFAVMLLDLDRFKLINDSFGHRAGDLMLIEIAERLRQCATEGEVLARLGGDEFAFLVENPQTPDAAAALAERVGAAVREPIHLNGQEVLTSASIGIAHATRYYRVPEEILRDADTAMYEAKRRHVGSLTFDDSMHRGLVMSSQLRTELRRAVQRSEFYVEYQPIFDLASRRITGAEALVRWQHPTRGRLPPEEFISLAEEMGLIQQIGTHVLREACMRMQEWRRRHPDRALRLSVNVSGHELTDIRFMPTLRDILAETGLDPGALQLEVTESVLFPTSEPITAVLEEAKALGVRFALDDFGTGYSSLGYLDRYPIDAIKIDQSFVAGIPGRQRTVSIVRAIIELAKALDLEVIAEGIERDGQMQHLLSLGCTRAQGFLLSKPVSADAVGKSLRRPAPRPPA